MVVKEPITNGVGDNVVFCAKTSNFIQCGFYTISANVNTVKNAHDGLVLL